MRTVQVVCERAAVVAVAIGAWRWTRHGVLCVGSEMERLVEGSMLCVWAALRGVWGRSDRWRIVLFSGAKENCTVAAVRRYARTQCEGVAEGLGVREACCECVDCGARGCSTARSTQHGTRGCLGSCEMFGIFNEYSATSSHSSHSRRWCRVTTAARRSDSPHRASSTFSRCSCCWFAQVLRWRDGLGGPVPLSGRVVPGRVWLVVFALAGSCQAGVGRSRPA